MATSIAHGGSRLATTRKVRKAGLFWDAGVVLYQTDDAEDKTPHRARRRSEEDGAQAQASLVRHDGLRLRPLADQPPKRTRATPDRPSSTDDKGAARMTYSCPTLLDPHGSNEPPTRGPTP